MGWRADEVDKPTRTAVGQQPFGGVRASGTNEKAGTVWKLIVHPTATWQEKRRESARQEILAAAWEAAHEHGLGALTLRDVAARVGMRAPSLYWHFDSKTALYDAMFGQA